MNLQIQSPGSGTLILFCVFCVPVASSTPPAFVDVSVEAGISATHVATYQTTGQAVADFDRDGCEDLMLTGGAAGNFLYRSLCDGTFEPSEYSDDIGMPSQNSAGANFVDYDNDGWPDLYVLSSGPNRLFRNLEGRGFIDVSEAAGVADEGWGESSAWADIDSDGNIDLYIVNYSQDGNVDRATDRLYRNLGDGQFENWSDSMPLAQRARAGFAARWLDYDNDGDPDLYVVNDKKEGNVLWRNDGSGCSMWCFSDVSVETGADRPIDGMGVSASDYDRDGDLDLYFSGSQEAALLQNQTAQGLDQFVEVTTAAGVDIDAVGWGVLFLDYDNDGWDDIYVATHNTQPELDNHFFRNNGDGTFEKFVGAFHGASSRAITMGVASLDFDGDGLLDLVAGNWNRDYRLFRNLGTGYEANQWLQIKLDGGERVNRDATGARVLLRTEDGVDRFKDVVNGNAFGSGSSQVLHFGLGQSRIESAYVRWPDGWMQVADQITPGRRFQIDRQSIIFSDSFLTYPEF